MRYAACTASSSDKFLNAEMLKGMQARCCCDVVQSFQDLYVSKVWSQPAAGDTECLLRLRSSYMSVYFVHRCSQET